MADYHSLLMRAVANLPNAGTPTTRAAIYGRARNALLEQLRSLRPPLPESDITREETRARRGDRADRRAIRVAGAGSDPRRPRRRRPRPSRIGKPGAAPAKTVPSPPPPQFSTVQRPSAPSAGGPPASSARWPSQPGAPGQPGPAATPVQAAAPRPRPPAQGPSQPAATPPQAPTLSAGRPAVAAGPTVASPARSQLAAAMANQPSSVSRTGRAAPSVSARGSEDEGLPGVAALDPAQAIRPGKTDDGDPFGAPRIVARRNDEAMQSGEAPEVAAEFDRPGLASRPEAEIQRPVAPGADVAKPKPLLWIAAAIVLGVVLAVAGVAILMRQKPQDLAIKPTCRDAATRVPGALGKDRGASPGALPCSGFAFISSCDRTAGRPAERSRGGGAGNPSA